MTEPSRALVEAAKALIRAERALRAVRASTKAVRQVAHGMVPRNDFSQFIDAYDIARAELAAESAQPSGGPK